MYEVNFYYDKNDVSDVVDYLDDLQQRSKTSKNERINFNKINEYIELLEQFGTYIGYPVTKHISGDLWELRPLSNRIFFFYWKDNKFILLHHFTKKTKKTPSLEIKKAETKMKDHKERHGD